jgi:hypothetical protein
MRREDARVDDLLRHYSADTLEQNARELLTSGGTTLANGGDRIEVRLVRFWNKSGIRDARRVDSTGSEHQTYTLVDRRELTGNPVPRLARGLVIDMANLGCSAPPADQ